MAQGRSLWREIFSNFINSLKPSKLRGELKGKDYLGNEYYEGPDNYHAGKKRRWFVPINAKEIHYELPTEWEAWLRYKRRVPPTEEEIELNRQKMESVVENAKRLEMQRKKTDKVLESGGSNFPTYKEYNE